MPLVFSVPTLIIAASTGTVIWAFDVLNGHCIVQIACSAISLQLFENFVVAGDAEGTISVWEIRKDPVLSKNATLSRMSKMPNPEIPAVLPHISSPEPLPQIDESGTPTPKTVKNVKRRSQWSSFPTPFKVLSIVNQEQRSLIRELLCLRGFY